MQDLASFTAAFRARPDLVFANGFDYDEEINPVNDEITYVFRLRPTPIPATSPLALILLCLGVVIAASRKRVDALASLGYPPYATPTQNGGVSTQPRHAAQSGMTKTRHNP